MRTAEGLSKKSKVSYRRNLVALYQKPVVQVSSALVMTVFAIVFFAAFAIRPTLATIVELNKKIEDQEEVVEKLEKKAVALATAQSEFILIEDKIPLVNAAIPEKKSLDTLLKQIEGLAASLNLPIDSLSVGEISYPEDKDAQRTDDLMEIPIGINFQADYPQIKEFMEQLVGITRLITVESISFSEDNLDTEAEGIKSSVSVKAFYLIPETEVIE